MHIGDQRNVVLLRIADIQRCIDQFFAHRLRRGAVIGVYRARQRWLFERIQPITGHDQRIVQGQSDMVDINQTHRMARQRRAQCIPFGVRLGFGQCNAALLNFIHQFAEK